MHRLNKAAILTRLMKSLQERENWCGETRIQKTTYFLQEFAGVPLEFGFILYWYGPYSFDLQDELTSLRADDILVLEPQSPPYGPQFITTDQASYIQSMFPKTLKRYSRHIEFTADRLGSRNVTELEKLATALYVTKRLERQASVEDRASELVRIKPHVSPDAAVSAIRETDEMIRAAGAFTSPPTSCP